MSGVAATAPASEPPEAASARLLPAAVLPRISISSDPPEA
jgi:hypothetical protein